MAAIYGHAWTSTHGDDPLSVSGLEWAAAVRGMTRAQIDTGLDVCRRKAQRFPPNPPEFRALCFGLASIDDVRIDLGTPKPKDRAPFTRLVWQYLDGWAYRHADARTSDRMLEQAHAKACEHVTSGGELPGEIAGELEAPKPRGAPMPEGQAIVPAAQAIAEALSMLPALRGSERHDLPPLHVVEEELRAHYGSVEHGEAIGPLA